jgi:hypothetical protein
MAIHNPARRSGTTAQIPKKQEDPAVVTAVVPNLPRRSVIQKGVEFRKEVFESLKDVASFLGGQRRCRLCGRETTGRTPTRRCKGLHRSQQHGQSESLETTKCRVHLPLCDGSSERPPSSCGSSRKVPGASRRRFDPVLRSSCSQSVKSVKPVSQASLRSSVPLRPEEELGQKVMTVLG